MGVTNAGTISLSESRRKLAARAPSAAELARREEAERTRRVEAQEVRRAEGAKIVAELSRRVPRFQAEPDAALVAAKSKLRDLETRLREAATGIAGEEQLVESLRREATTAAAQVEVGTAPPKAAAAARDRLDEAVSKLAGARDRLGALEEAVCLQGDAVRGLEEAFGRVVREEAARLQRDALRRTFKALAELCEADETLLDVEREVARWCGSAGALAPARLSHHVRLPMGFPGAVGEVNTPAWCYADCLRRARINLEGIVEAP